MPESVHFDFAELFDAEEYLYFMADSLREEDTPRQVDFLEKVLSMTRPMHVLDLGCGHGRHTNELARRGHRAVGVDLVEGFVDLARNEALRDGLSSEFHHGDMGAFEADGVFDRVVCLFDAFGFFDDAHALATLRNVHRALVPDGRFFLDLRTREWMLRVPPVNVVDKGNGDLMIDRNHFDLETGRFVDRRTTVRGGRTREVAFSVRLYSFTEIRFVLETLGFAVEAAYGGFDGSPLSVQRSRTLVVARKVAPAPPASVHGASVGAP
jgi:SAM-dependent methyltransferase